MRRLLLAAVLVPLLAGCGGARTVTTAATTTKAGVPKNERHFLKVPLRVVKGGNHTTLAVVPVYIGSKGPYDFALDTGASVSVVDLAVVHELGLKRIAEGRRLHRDQVDDERDDRSRAALEGRRREAPGRFDRVGQPRTTRSGTRA